MRKIERDIRAANFVIKIIDDLFERFSSDGKFNTLSARHELFKGTGAKELDSLWNVDAASIFGETQDDGRNSKPFVNHGDCFCGLFSEAFTRIRLMGFFRGIFEMQS